MPLNQTDRDRLVDALLNCQSMTRGQSRAAIVRDLPKYVRQALTDGLPTKEAVVDIVKCCSNVPQGLETLLDRVKYFEGETAYSWMALKAVADEVTMSSSSVPVSPMASAPQIAPTKAKAPVQVFFSYSHRDEDLRDELSKHLSILKRQGVIHEWHDRQIPAGSEWKEAIDDRMNQAQVILLLISSDFLASDYCHEIEMKRALERHDNKEAIVIPIILRSCDWQGALFGKLQALPKDAKPVTKWPDKDEAFTSVAQGIRKVIEGLA